MEKSSVWTRIGAWLRGDEPRDGFSQGSAQGAAHSLVNPPPAKDGPSLSAPPAESSTEPAATNPTASATAAKSEASLHEMVGSIKEHLQAQVQSADVLVESLDRLAGGLERLPDVAKDELGVLEHISEDVSAAVASLKRVESSLGEWAEWGDAQREVLHQLARTLDQLRETDGKIAASLDGLQHGVVELRESVTETSGMMRAFRTEWIERHDRLVLRIEQQTNRLTVLAIAAAGLGAVAALLGILAMTR